MTAAAIELQKAIFARLTGDAGLTGALGGPQVYDHAPADVAFPYITFGRSSVYDWSTATEDGSEHLFTLHFWSKARGKTEAAELMETARALLHDTALALDGRSLVNLRLEFADIGYDDDLVVYHGLMRFRAAVEESGE